MVGEIKASADADTQEREKITEKVAEDHARLLSTLGQCLAEIGTRAALTTFHKIILRADTFHLPARYEPELDVFRPDDEKPGPDHRPHSTIQLIEQKGSLALYRDVADS
jgi:hypothetical protein